MLSSRQIAICALLALAFWAVAALAIHAWPASFTDPVGGTAGFALSLPVGWLCVRLTRRCAKLSAAQLPAACLVVLAVAASVDGVALRYVPTVYSADDQTCRMAAALLLWGYGASAFAALVMARRGAEAGLAGAAQN